MRPKLRHLPFIETRKPNETPADKGLSESTRNSIVDFIIVLTRK